MSQLALGFSSPGREDVTIADDVWCGLVVRVGGAVVKVVGRNAAGVYLVAPCTQARAIERDVRGPVGVRVATEAEARRIGPVPVARVGRVG